MIKNSSKPSDGHSNPPSSRPMTLNQKYGLTEIYQHDLNGAGICKKCHTNIADIKLKICPVIGSEEVARFRDYDER